MPYESEEVEEEEEVESEDSSGEKKEYTEDEMVEYLVNEAGTVEEFSEILEKHGWEIRKKGESEEKEDSFGEIEKEMGIRRGPIPALSVLRVSSARNALKSAGKGK